MKVTAPESSPHPACLGKAHALLSLACCTCEVGSGLLCLPQGRAAPHHTLEALSPQPEVISFAVFPRALSLTFSSERVDLDRGGDARPWEAWMREDEVKKLLIWEPHHEVGETQRIRLDVQGLIYLFLVFGLFF